MNAQKKPGSRPDHAGIRYIVEAAMIAALYVALTVLCALAGLASMPIQARLSEALCILTLYTPAAVPGLFIGCLLANLLTGGVVWDIVFGSLATLLGAMGGRILAHLAGRAARAGYDRRARTLTWFVPLPTVLSNTVIVPFVLRYAYSIEDALSFLFLTVGLGEVLSAWIFGLLLLAVCKRRKRLPFDT